VLRRYPARKGRTYAEEDAARVVDQHRCSRLVSSSRIGRNTPRITAPEKSTNMGLEFASPLNETSGVIASLLERSYAALVASEPSLWRGEQVRWEQYDREVFQQPETALVTTCDHPFFVPARRMYQACGFHEVRRVPWDRDPGRTIIEYERQVDRQDHG
jgi:hypothetical protein